MKFYLALFIIFLFVNVKSSNSIENSTVKAVVEIMRHGARTPLTYLENSAKLYFGSRKAQLTINGLRQHILLGRWLRRRYFHAKETKLFSKKLFNPNEIQVFSSPLQRTIFSATGHINGLFPKSIIRIKYHGLKQIKTNDVPPIKNFKLDSRDGKEVIINVINRQKDYVFHADKCRRASSKVKNIFREMKKTKLFKITEKERELAINDIMKKYEKLLSDKIKNHGKHEKKTMPINKKIHKVLSTRLQLKKLLAWLRPFKYHTNFSKLLEKNTSNTMKKHILKRWYGSRLVDTPALKQVTSYIFKEIHKLFSRKVTNKEQRKMIIFTGHDTNIVNTLTNLLDHSYLKKKILNSLTNDKYYKFLVPPLASSIIFELHKMKGKKEYFIKVLYNGEEINKNFIRPVKVKNNRLDYDDFMALLFSRIIKGTKNLICGKGVQIR